MEQELANKLIESVNQLSTFTMNDDSKMIGMLTEIEYTGEPDQFYFEKRFQKTRT